MKVNPDGSVDIDIGRQALAQGGFKLGDIERLN